jgi:hypothetical protein
LIAASSPDRSKGTEQAVKHRRVGADLAGNTGSRPILVGFEMGEDVKRCPGV